MRDQLTPASVVLATYPLLPAINAMLEDAQCTAYISELSVICFQPLDVIASVLRRDGPGGAIATRLGIPCNDICRNVHPPSVRWGGEG